MEEKSNSNSTIPKEDLTKIVLKIEDDPRSDEVWLVLIGLARKEQEVLKKVKDEEVRLDEIVKFGERLRNSEDFSKKHKLLFEKDSTGKLWYDIILGNANNRMFKPAENELDLVITGGEYGKGKRAGALSTFTISCINEKGEFLEIGKASGLKEKQEEGLSFIELTKKIKPLITKEHGRSVEIKPKIVVTIVYQNIQRSPTYKSGFALRFPR